MEHLMKLGFGAAMIASLSLSVVSSPVASQTTNCAELRLQERYAAQELSAAQTQLALFNYEFKKNNLTQWFYDKMGRCETYGAGMDTECKQETEEEYDQAMQELDSDNAALEAEVSAAESALLDLNYQLVSANCLGG